MYIFIICYTSSICIRHNTTITDDIIHIDNHIIAYYIIHYKSD
ncbi:hypothetical protein MCHI_002901 [Candidatus Magnetoovum chiemensis]|nr:hypothetical protein MCHI_002901 [Candidatus Magnetoovum chiemensis]